MSDPYTIKRVSRPQHTRRLRSQGKPKLWIIHATRGHTTLELQDQATLNWFQYAPDNGGWGSTADVLISADDDLIHEFGDIMREHSAWSAGYGSQGSRTEYGADEWGISIELAQTHKAEPFTEHVINKLVWYIRKRSVDFGLDIPAVHLTSWSQRRSDPVPTGFIGHDETANGRKTGKSDPGSHFPWADVMRRVSEKAPPKEKPVSLTAFQQQVVDEIRKQRATLTDVQIAAALESIGLTEMPGEATESPVTPPAAPKPSTSAIAGIEAELKTASEAIIRARQKLAQIK